MLATLRALQRNPEVIAMRAVESSKSQIEDTQREQMSRGEDNKGAEIGRLRNASYARRKKARGGQAPFGVVDLKNTGKFQRGVFATVQPKAVFLDSRDSKRQKLTSKYGNKIFGFNDKSVGLAKDQYLKDAAIEELRKLL
jgi:hypothetical protein